MQHGCVKKKPVATSPPWFPASWVKQLQAMAWLVRRSNLGRTGRVLQLGVELVAVLGLSFYSISDEFSRAGINVPVTYHLTTDLM